MPSRIRLSSRIEHSVGLGGVHQPFLDHQLAYRLVLDQGVLRYLGRLVVADDRRQRCGQGGAALRVGAATLAVGLAANLFLVRWLVGLFDAVLERIPLVTTLYQALKDIARGLDALLARDGFASVTDAVGSGRADWT